jgi:diazepam-binding inhibitor (GABA receptor modulating acyl-CoA-binding protein)
MSDLAQQFADAQARIKQATGLGNDALLELYALYKQATAGDVSGGRPGMLDLRGRAKYDAWAQRKGMTAEAAMTAYVAVVDRATRRAEG